MTSTLLITGPAGAGKNTVAEVLARKRERCAIIDVDYVREIVVQPQFAPWDGEEGARQVALGVRNSCMLANSLRADGYDVIILDVIDSAVIETYRRLLSGKQFKLAMLLPELDETLRRNRDRIEALRLEDWRVVELHAQQAAFTGHDLRLDNTHLSPEEAAERLNALMSEA